MYISNPGYQLFSSVTIYMCYINTNEIQYSSQTSIVKNLWIYMYMYMYIYVFMYERIYYQKITIYNISKYMILFPRKARQKIKRVHA